MALGMMPCSSSDVTVSKPVPIVYVFPAPVCNGKERMQMVNAGPPGEPASLGLGQILLPITSSQAAPFRTQSHTLQNSLIKVCLG